MNLETILARNELRERVSPCLTIRDKENYSHDYKNRIDVSCNYPWCVWLSLSISTCTLTSRLPARMQDLYVKRLRECALHHSDICAIPLVGSDHRVGSPVSPVDVVLKQSNGKGVRQGDVPTHHLSVVRSVVQCCVYWVWPVVSNKQDIVRSKILVGKLN